MDSSKHSIKEFSKSILEKNKSWWEKNPMTYNWKEKIEEIPISLNYFNEIDSRMRAGHGFAQDPGHPIFSKLIPYELLKGKKVLEIGCGMGSIAQEFAQRGANITAVDIASRAIELSSERFRLKSLPGTFIQANAEELPFKNNTFDYVWSWGVLHHTPGTKQAVQEIRRVLKQSGKIGIMLYNRHSIRNIVRVLLLRGILQLKLLRYSLEELENRYSDGYIAKHYSAPGIKKLFTDFSNLRLSIYGQRSEVFPGFHRLPRWITFPWEPLLQFMLRKFGWFLFLQGEKLS